MILIAILSALISSTNQISGKYPELEIDPTPGEWNSYIFSLLMNSLMSKFRFIFGSLNFPSG